MNRPRYSRSGFTLVELSIALFAVSVLSAGTVQLARSASEAFRLQQSLAELHENARFGLQMMSTEIAQAGYSPRPWQTPDSSEILEGSADEASDTGDVLVAHRWSDRNCFENANPATGADGQPLFYRRVARFDVSAAGQLAMTCLYGPDNDSLVTQVQHLGLVENVLALQALYAVDDSGDGNAERWAAAGGWAPESQILGVRLGLVMQSPERFEHALLSASSRVLGSVVPATAGHLHRVVETSVAIEGQLRR